MWLHNGEESLRISLGVSTEYRRDRWTDGQKDEQTDGRTSCHGIVRAMRTGRAVKMSLNIHATSSRLYRLSNNYNKVTNLCVGFPVL